MKPSYCNNTNFAGMLHYLVTAKGVEMSVVVQFKKLNDQSWASSSDMHPSYMVWVPKAGFVPERNLSFLYSDLKIYSITWEGDNYENNMDTLLFDQFWKIIRESLNDILGSTMQIDEINCSFDFLYEKIGGISHTPAETIKVATRHDIDEVKARLKRFYRYSFIREDLSVSCNGKKYDYAMTAVKPYKGIPEHFSEVGILLPIEHRLTKQNLKWILRLHKYGSAFLSDIDVDESLKEFNRYLDSFQAMTDFAEDKVNVNEKTSSKSDCKELIEKVFLSNKH